MRKCAALLMVLLIVAGAAFAQVADEEAVSDTVTYSQIPEGFSVGGWGRAVFVPLQGVFPDGGDAKYYSGVGSGWGRAYTGVSLKFSHAEGLISGQLDISGGTGIGDNLFIATKPFRSDILYLLVGQVRNNDYRGPGTDNEFQGYIGGPGKDGDAVFNRFEPNGGALFISKPVPGLSIYAQLDPGASTITEITPALKNAVEANNVYKRIQTGFAYDISGIGLARAQYVGNTGDFTITNGKFTFDPDTYDGSIPLLPTTGTSSVDGWKYTAGSVKPNPARIEAAFKVTAVPGLKLDLGLKLPIPVKKDDILGLGYDVTFQDNFQVAVAGDYTSGDFKLGYGLYAGFGGSFAIDATGATRQDLQPTFNLILTPSFYVAAVDATVGLDVGFKVKGDGDFALSDTGTVSRGTITAMRAGTATVENSSTFGIGAWINRNLGKGDIKTGLAYQFPTYGENGTVGEIGYLTVPVVLTISF
jgi:hypothetical protein